jgi:Rieske Fe-S protein
MWTDILAAEIKPLTVPSASTLRLNLPDFPALLSESGSVRLTMNPLKGGPPSGPVPDGQFFPVIINRAANDVFYALNSRCTHQGCVVPTLDASTSRMICPCHGPRMPSMGNGMFRPPDRTDALHRQFDGQDTVVQI